MAGKTEILGGAQRDGLHLERKSAKWISKSRCGPVGELYFGRGGPLVDADAREGG